MTGKTCSRCTKPKPIADFGEDGRYKMCEACRSSRRRLYAEKTADRPRYGSEEWRRAISEGQRRRFVRDVGDVEHLIELPDHWRCSRCVRLGRKGFKRGTEFGTRTERTRSGVLRTHYRTECRSCEAERQRERRQRDPESQQRQLDRQRRWKESNRDKVREYQRIWAEGKRRRLGVPVNHVLLEQRRSVAGLRADVKLPLAPFQGWIHARAAYYAALYGETGRPGEILGIGTLARECGITDRTLRRFVEGVDNGRTVTHIPLGTVDACLTREGSTLLHDLYDEIPSASAPKRKHSKKSTSLDRSRPPIAA